MILSGEVRKKLILRKARQKAIEQLTKDGFKVVGGNPRLLNHEEAHALVAHVDDASIMANLPKGALGDGSILQRLEDIIQWIKDHKEQILKIISIILSLAMLFLDDHVSDEAPASA